MPQFCVKHEHISIENVTLRGGGHSTLVWVGMAGALKSAGMGVKRIDFFAKVRPKELKVYNNLRA